MLTRLLSLLLLLASTLLTFESECRGATASLSDAAGCSLPQAGSDCQEELSPRTSPAQNESRRESETQYKNGLPEAELFVSASEKFNSSFCESMVLHLVAKTTGKLLPLDLVDKNPRSPSLVCLSVMLQV